MVVYYVRTVEVVWRRQPTASVVCYLSVKQRHALKYRFVPNI